MEQKILFYLSCFFISLREKVVGTDSVIKDVFAILARNRKPPVTITKLIRQPLYVPAARGVLDVLPICAQSASIWRLS